MLETITTTVCINASELTLRRHSIANSEVVITVTAANAKYQ
jgi:hypothetical protein